jgi:hypothetical protein
MKKNSQRKPKPKIQQRPAPATKARGAAADCPPGYEHGHEERKVGIVSGTPADAFDETAERKRDKWVAIYISVLAVLIAIAATGSNDAMKTAQQAGFGVNDNYAFYQAKTIRQQQIKIASDQLELKQRETPNLPEPAQKLLQSSKSEYDREIARLETNRKNGKKELLAKAESCENERSLALAQHPFYDYSMAMLQIAIVLASASIITGTRLLLGASGLVGIFGVLFFLNGYTLVAGAPKVKDDRFKALQHSLGWLYRFEAPIIARCPLE